jgi:hypothetical protein
LPSNKNKKEEIVATRKKSVERRLKDYKDFLKGRKTKDLTYGEFLNKMDKYFRGSGFFEQTMTQGMLQDAFKGKLDSPASRKLILELAQLITTSGHKMLLNTDLSPLHRKVYTMNKNSILEILNKLYQEAGRVR